MTKKHLKLQTLKKNLLNIYKKNKDIIFDIVLFGSITKGKEYTEDIDVCIILKKKEINQIKNLKLNENIHINYLTLEELYTQPLWKTIIREGYSIVKKKKVSEIFNLNSFGLFTYTLTKLKNKSRFSQILKGYKSESILKKTKGQILKPGVILIPIEHVEHFRTFLEVWKVDYTLKYIYLE